MLARGLRALPFRGNNHGVVGLVQLCVLFLRSVFPRQGQWPGFNLAQQFVGAGMPWGVRAVFKKKGHVVSNFLMGCGSSSTTENAELTPRPSQNSGVQLEEFWVAGSVQAPDGGVCLAYVLLKC